MPFYYEMCFIAYSYNRTLFCLRIVMFFFLNWYENGIMRTTDEFCNDQFMAVDELILKYNIKSNQQQYTDLLLSISTKC